MAKREKTEKPVIESDDITDDLITAINKQFGSVVAYNLAEGNAPTIIKRWLDTGCIQLNYMIRNAAGGGYPEGRIIEISGQPSTGKSHLAYHTAAIVQQMGGLVVFIDSENATDITKLQHMGIDVTKRFVYCDEHCTESVFQVIEATILKAKQVLDKNISILVVWDSVAATSPKEELEGEYDKNTMGLQARVISKAMRKITGVIGDNNVTLLCLNQLRSNIGQMHGDPFTTPGGKAIPFHSSIRIRLSSGTPVKDKDGNTIGIHVICTLKKNKVGLPFRKCEFDIMFGKGIVEHEYIFDEVRAHCSAKGAVVRDGKSITVSGTGAWKELVVNDSTTGEVVVQKKFYKSEFGDLLKDPVYAGYLMQAIDATYTIDISNSVADDGRGDEDIDD